MRAPRPWIVVGGLALVAVVVVLLARDPGGPSATAARWVEVQNLALEECSVLDLYSEDYLEEQGLDAGRCAEDPASFFMYWYMPSDTQQSSFELGEVAQEDGTAVAHVTEVGGAVPELLLFLVTEDGEWVVEAVGAEPVD